MIPEAIVRGKFRFRGGVLKGRNQGGGVTL